LIVCSLLLQLPLFSFLLFNPDLILVPLEVAAGIVRTLNSTCTMYSNPYIHIYFEVLVQIINSRRTTKLFLGGGRAAAFAILEICKEDMKQKSN
jgi:hypothetical protein